LGVKLSIPILPPGRQTRTSSSATAWWFGGEHRPERGGDDVELVIVEGEPFCVSLHPLELYSVSLGFAATRLEVLGRQIRGDDLGPGLGGPDCRVAGPRGHIEDALPGRDPARLHQHRPEPPDRLAREPVVVAERPGGPRGRLELAVGVRRRLCA
jgi:hypothetical protein